MFPICLFAPQKTYDLAPAQAYIRQVLASVNAVGFISLDESREFNEVQKAKGIMLI
jgi:hypothetical protein